MVAGAPPHRSLTAAFTGGVHSSRATLRSPQQLQGICPESTAENNELGGIETPLAQLDLRDEGLTTSDPLGELDLTHAGGLPGFD